MERCVLRMRLNAHHPTVTIELCDLALLYSNGRVQQLGWGFKELQKDLQDFNLQKGLRDVLYRYLNKMVSVVLEFLVIFCDLGLINSTRTNANSRDSREGNPNQVPA